LFVIDAVFDKHCIHLSPLRDVNLPRSGFSFAAAGSVSFIQIARQE
jgi:hypothetical protein